MPCFQIRFASKVLSAAEMTRRLVMHRDIPEPMRWPNATWTDAQSIMSVLLIKNVFIYISNRIHYPLFRCGN